MTDLDLTSIGELQRLAVFAMVVDAGTFTAAAAELGMSKAAVSKQVQRLEAHLGIQLLQRTTRRLATTEAGKAVALQARRMLHEANRARALVDAQLDAPTGHLRVAAPVGLGQRLVAPALGRFVASHPGVTTELALSDQRIDLVGEGFDLAIRGGALADSSLTCRKLAPLELILCAAPAYLVRAGEPREPGALRDHEWVGHSALGNPFTLSLRQGKRRRRVRVEGGSETNDGAVLRDWLMAGLGIGLLPVFWIADDLARGHLRRVLPQWSLPPAGIYAVHAHGRRPPAKLRAFIDHLADSARRFAA